MKRTFASEDKRKDRLFEACNEYIQSLRSKGIKECMEVIEDCATVTKISKNLMVLKFDDRKNSLEIPIPSKISKNLEKDDYIGITLGRKGEEWWPLDFSSIGSVVSGRESGIHLTVNPLYMDQLSPSQTRKH